MNFPAAGPTYTIVPHFPPVVFAIAFAALVVALTALARKLPIPTPILQVLAGLLVVLVPGVTIPDLDPDIVFFVFLPPILWSAAMFTSPREFKKNIGPITLLAVGLVLVTTATVAIAARMLMPSLPWAIAVALGALVGWLIIRAACYTRDALAETLITLAGPYVAWLVADTLHVSAVLACVCGGLYLQRNLSVAVGLASRLQTRNVWDLLVFLLNAMIFLLLGAQFGTLMEMVPAGSLSEVMKNGVIIAIVCIVVRLAWVPLATIAMRLDPERRRREPPVKWRSIALVSWTSMRGVVSLATALALPRTLESGAPFPFRTEVILITMAVIVMTLLVQGLTLAPLIRWMKFDPEVTHHAEERLARREATRRGAEALEDLSHEDWVDQSDVDALRTELRDRVQMNEHHGGSHEGRRRLRAGMIAAERRMLIRLRNENEILDEVLRNLEQELDLEAVRVGAGETAG